MITKIICPRCATRMKKIVKEKVLKCEKCDSSYQLCDDSFYDIRVLKPQQDHSLLIHERPPTFNAAFSQSSFEIMINQIQSVVYHGLKECFHANILDIGCGNGYYANIFRNYESHYYGLEPSDIPFYRVISPETINQDSVTLLHYEPEKGIPVSCSSFDMALLVSSYDHIPNRLDVLNEILTKIVPGGKLVIIMTNKDFWIKKILRRCLHNENYGSHRDEHFCEHSPHTLIDEVVSNCETIDSENVLIYSNYFVLPNLGWASRFYFCERFVTYLNRIIGQLLKIVYKTDKVSKYYGSSMIVMFQKVK